MKYTDIRHYVQKHFRERLAAFKEQVDREGPIGDARVKGVRDVIRAAEGDLATFVNHIYLDDEDALLRDFCEKEGIVEALSATERQLVLREFQLAYGVHAKAALAHNATYDDVVLEEAPKTDHSDKLSTATDSEGLEDAIKLHLEEGMRANLWREKTVNEKREALALLRQLTEDKPLSSFTKSDARLVKSALQKLPKNRNKSPATRHLPLKDMLQLEGVPFASVRTLNAYVSHFQTFFKWAMEQGYADENIFDGMRFRMAKRDKAAKRDAFTNAQLKVMFEHLTENPDGLVRKDEHKWVTLIGMFTGARLNEIAQLGVGDLSLHERVWCLSLTTDGDDNKRLKNEASKRVVPVHDTLLKCGIEAFAETARSRGQVRLFPGLSYDSQNGYGRNVGRWFNESLLVKLGMKTSTLSFHCLRHTMNTQLAQKNTPEHLQKAILGHTQSGMSYSTYLKEGFLPSQLQPEINKFSIQ